MSARSARRGLVPASALLCAALAGIGAAVVAPDPAQAEPLSRRDPTEGVLPTVLPMLEQTFTAEASAGEFRERDGFTVVVPPPPEPPEPEPTATAIAPAASSVPTVVAPVDGPTPAAGAFGPRRIVGCGACSTDHRGLDFAVPYGSAVGSAMSGTVVEAGPAGGYGLSVLVDHGAGLATRYAHLSAVHVAPGARVVAGQRIGDVGSTGVSTGPHLHFEVVRHGVRVDPAAWLSAAGVR